MSCRFLVLCALLLALTAGISATASAAGGRGSIEISGEQQVTIVKPSGEKVALAGADAQFSPNGKEIAYLAQRPEPNSDGIGEDALVVASADGSNAKVVAASTDGSIYSNIAWAPDGAAVAIVAFKTDGYNSTYTLSWAKADGASPLVSVIEDPNGFQQVAWAANATIVYQTSDKIYQVHLDGQQKKLVAGNPNGLFALSADRQAVIYPETTKNLAVKGLVVKSLAGGAKRVLPAPVGSPIHAIVPSPDGRTILFSAWTSWDNSYYITDDLFSVGTDGKGFRRLTYTVQSEEAESFSPDSRQVAIEIGSTRNQWSAAVADAQTGKVVRTLGSIVGNAGSEETWTVDWQHVTVVSPKPAPHPAPKPTRSGVCRSKIEVAGTLTLTAACFKEQGTNVWHAHGRISVNGLNLNVDGAATAELDKDKLTVSGGVSWNVAGVDFRLGDGFTWTPQQKSFDVSTAGKLKGLPVSGSAKVTFSAAKGGSALINLGAQVTIPKFDAALQGAAAFSVSTLDGVNLDGITIKTSGEIHAGAVTLKNFSLDYRSADDSWVGKGIALFPGSDQAINGELGLKGGAFSYASLTWDTDLPLFDDMLTLTKLSVSVKIEPLSLSGGVSVAFGPSVNNYSLFSSDAKLTWVSPYHWQVNGDLEMMQKLLSQVGAAVGINGTLTVDYVSTGVVAHIHGQVNVKLKSLSVNTITVDGSISKAGFNATGNGGIDVGVGGADGQVILSSIGAAGCMDIFVGRTVWGVNFKHVIARIGKGYLWQQGFTKVEGCDLAPFRVAMPQVENAPRALTRFTANSTATVTVGDVPYEVFAAYGDGGVPDITVTSPTGQTVVDTTGQTFVNNSDLFIWHDADDNAVYVAVPVPAQGAWTVAQSPASPVSVSQIEAADPLPPLSIKATVTPAGGRRQLTYSIAGLVGGETVSFFESVDGVPGSLPIALNVTSSGRALFTPSPLGSKFRSVFVLVSENGVPSQTLTVAPFTVTPVAPPVSSKVTAHVARGRVTFSWHQSGGAAARHWRVRVRVGKSAVEHTLAAKQRSFTVKAKKSTLVRFAVAGVDRFGRIGKLKSASRRSR